LEWNCKTKASRKPVPLHPFVLDQLQDWRQVSLWNNDEDFVFPSVRLNGKKPISPVMVLRRHIRRALEELGIKKRGSGGTPSGTASAQCCVAGALI